MIKTHKNLIIIPNKNNNNETNYFELLKILKESKQIFKKTFQK